MSFKSRAGSSRTTSHAFRRRVPARAALVAVLLAGSTLGGLTAGSLETRPALAQGASQSAPIHPQMPEQTLPSFTGLVKQVKPAVVSITAMLRASAVPEDEGGSEGGGGGQQMPFPFPFPFQMPQANPHRIIEARGSGFIISPDGYVVTNNHVVNGATSVKVTLDDGSIYTAKIVGRDPSTDLALLRINRSEKFPFIKLGDSSTVEPGQWVIAVGNPFGLGGTVTAGIVSALGRNIGDGPYDSFLQIDAPINRGNSGGPLFDQEGQVIGVNTAIISPTGGSVGIGFAIPSDTVRAVVAQLKAHGKVTRGFLGVSAQEISPAMAKALSLPKSIGNPPSGALVASVVDGSPAQQAGLKPGDVIVSVDGKKITDPRDLAVQIAGVVPGSDATLKVLRDGNPKTLSAHITKLGKNSATPGGDNENPNHNESIGVSLSALTPDVRQQLGLDDSVRGVAVKSVRSGSAADQAGIQPGDIIVGVGNQAVSSPQQAVSAVHASLKNDNTVALRILRNGQTVFVAISPDENSGNGANQPPDDNGGNPGNDGGAPDNGDQG